MTSPQKLFLENEDAAAAWRTMAHSRAFEYGLSLAIAQFATTRPSSQELVGALNFVNLLVELADKIPEEQLQPFMPRLTPPEQLVPETYYKKAETKSEPKK